MTAPSFTGTKYPGALDDLASLPVQNVGDVITSLESNNQTAAIKAVEARLGVSGSVVATSFEFIVKNISSGHHHDNVGSRRVTYANLASIPSTFAPATHGASAHSGDVLPDASDQALGAGSLNIAPRTAAGVATPGSGRTIFVDSADGSVKVKDDTGAVIALEGGGGSGGGGAPFGAQYLVGTADPDLTSEIVVGTSPGGELGGSWASPTVDDLHAGVAHSAMARLAAANTHTLGPNIFASGGASIKALIARGAVAQSANLQEWQDSSGGALASVAPTGVFSFPSAQYGTPGASAPGDSAAAGASALLARSDHRHSRETPATGASISDVAAAASPGVSGSFPRADHVHGHGVGYLVDAHHTQIHSDADHSGPSKVTVLDHDLIRGTRPLLHFPYAALAADNSAEGRIDINLPPKVVPFWSGFVLSWAMTSGLSPFGGDANIRNSVLELDLRYVSEVKLVASTRTPGPAGSSLRLLYAITDLATSVGWAGFSTTPPVITPCDVANTVTDSGWHEIPTNARIEHCFVSLWGRDGNGTTTATFPGVWVMFR